MADMKDIHNCVICEKRLKLDRDHVDTCKGACYQALLKRQRAAIERLEREEGY